MSVFGELRVETCLSVLPLSVPSSPFPLPHTVHVLLITPKSRSGPRAFTFSDHMVWSSGAPLLEIPPPAPTIKHPTPTNMCTGRQCMWFVHIYPIQNVNTCTHLLYTNITHHVPIHTHTSAHARLPPLSFPGVLLIDSACSCKGLWWKTVGVDGVGVLWRGEGVWGRGEGDWERGLRIRPTELH